MFSEKAKRYQFDMYSLILINNSVVHPKNSKRSQESISWIGNFEFSRHTLDSAVV